MKTYEIIIEPIVFTNDFPFINKTIRAKRIEPATIFKEYDVIDIKRISKYVYHIKAGYGLFCLTVLEVI